MDDARFEQLLARMARAGIASGAELVGCSPAEVAALEGRYRVRLPAAYRRYLEVMGHRSGRLFTHDHMAVSYGHVLDMTADERRAWAECNAEDEDGPPPGFELPADALLIAGRLGDQFEFIRCGGLDDSPVWCFDTWEWQPQESNPSVLAWLEVWCGEAERAIAGGYFAMFPEGTTP